MLSESNTSIFYLCYATIIQLFLKVKIENILNYNSTTRKPIRMDLLSVIYL